MALRGVRVLELAGLAPAPFCGMILADLGADVVRVDRRIDVPNFDVTARGKRSVVVDLKSGDGAAVFRKMCANADVLIEPFRKGVMEKLHLGPDILMQDNPALVYARLTGFGQMGYYSDKAGHDINFLSITGLLSTLGRKSNAPFPPINLMADFAGGGLMCAFGILAALLERTSTNKGQVIDANMVEGAAYVGSWIFKSQDMFVWGKGRGENVLDSGAHFYETYETKDGKYMAVGAIEPQFYEDLLKGLAIDENQAPHFGDYEASKELFRQRFRQKTRQEWTEIFDNLDACVTPVLELDEAPHFIHNHERGAFHKNCHGKYDPIPAPRFSRHKDVETVVARPEPRIGEHSVEVLREFGFEDNQIGQLLQNGVIQTAPAKAKL